MRHPTEGALRRLVDEPAGVADADREHVAGCAVCLSELGEVEQVCDRLVILDNGQVAVSGTLAELLGRSELRLRLDGITTQAEQRLAAAGQLTRSGNSFTWHCPPSQTPPPCRTWWPTWSTSGCACTPSNPAGSASRSDCWTSSAPVPARSRHDRPDRSHARPAHRPGGRTPPRLARARRNDGHAAGAQRLGILRDASFGTLTSGQAQLAASTVLNLVMFGLSLIAALGTAFLAGPTLAGETESGTALAVLSRPIHRSAVLLGKWLGLVVFGSGFVAVAGLALLLVVWVTVGYWPPQPVAGLALLAAQATVLLTRPCCCPPSSHRWHWAS